MKKTKVLINMFLLKTEMECASKERNDREVATLLDTYGSTFECSFFFNKIT